MQIELGKFYVDGNGKKIGPMEHRGGTLFKGDVHPDKYYRYYTDKGEATGMGNSIVSEFGETPTTVDALHEMKSKLTNPKDAIGSSKIPIHLWPTTATVMGSMGLLDGMLKYGRSNFRDAGVRFSIYFDAAMRHFFRLASGEDTDPDSGLPHEAHILACVAILVDAKAAGKLNDDREVLGGLLKLIEALTPHVARLKEQHKDKNPKHFTIADNVKEVKDALPTDA